MSCMCVWVYCGVMLEGALGGGAAKVPKRTGVTVGHNAWRSAVL